MTQSCELGRVFQIGFGPKLETNFGSPAQFGLSVGDASGNWWWWWWYYPTLSEGWGSEELREDPTVGPHPKVWTIDQEWRENSQR